MDHLILIVLKMDKTIGNSLFKLWARVPGAVKWGLVLINQSAFSSRNACVFFCVRKQKVINLSKSCVFPHHAHLDSVQWNFKGRKQAVVPTKK